jgi:hypothetical protein
MPVICPKCSHVRPADATNPDWQCPACGICYAKFKDRAAEQARLARNLEIEVKHGWGLGWLFKAVLLVALVWGLGTAIARRQHAPAVEDVITVQQAGAGPGVAIVDAALQVSEADAGMLHGLSGRLEKACARNKYGLSEDACVTRLREREDGCVAKTAQRFPGQIGDAGRMQVIAQAYAGCVFEADE